MTEPYRATPTGSPPTPYLPPRPMTDQPLSHAAQAVLDAFTGNDTIHGLHLMTPRLAAALRAAADQVVPAEDEGVYLVPWNFTEHSYLSIDDIHDECNHLHMRQRQDSRRQLLAIAAELETQ